MRFQLTFLTCLLLSSVAIINIRETKGEEGKESTENTPLISEAEGGEGESTENTPPENETPPDATTPTANNALTTTENPNLHDPHINDTRHVYDNIHFNNPDVVVTHRLNPGDEVTIEAFRVGRKLLSFGYPEISTGINGSVFHYTRDYVVVYIKTLDNAQSETLLSAGKVYSPKSIFAILNFLSLPNVQFGCDIEFQQDGIDYKMHGNVQNFNKIPFEVKFPLKSGSKKRLAFINRQKQNGKAGFLALQCNLAASANENSPNFLKITAEEMQNLNIPNKVMGSDNATYMLSEQMADMANEIKSGLNLPDGYEIENHNFADEVLEKILDKHGFQDFPITEALTKLSKYNIPNDFQNFTTEEIIQELEFWFVVSNKGNSNHIIVNEHLKDPSNTLDFGHTPTAIENYVMKIFQLENQVNFVRNESKKWLRDVQPASLISQLTQINSKGKVKFDLDGDIVIAKSLKSIKVSKEMIQQEMTFPLIKRKILNAMYHKNYLISTGKEIHNTGLSNYKIANISIPKAKQIFAYEKCVMNAASNRNMVR